MTVVNQQSNVSISRAFGQIRSRLVAINPYTPLMILLPFLAASLLSLYVGFETSARFRAGIEPFFYQASKSNDHKLWMSVGLNDGRIVVKTSAKGIFSWSAAGPNDDEYRAFERHMQQWAKEHFQGVIVEGQLRPESNVAAISIDQRLTFHHVRPIIYALAASGISRYGFETKLIDE